MNCCLLYWHILLCYLITGVVHLTGSNESRDAKNWEKVFFDAEIIDKSDSLALGYLGI